MTDDRLGPPPVEPMSDLAWARVERGMWSRLDHPPAALPARRRGGWLAVPVVAAAAAVVIAVVALREGPSPTLPAPAPSPVTSTELSRVVSGASPSSITFADAHIALDANSALVLTSEGTSPATLLERGAAWFTVAPRADRPAFIVRAGDTVVRVIGTRFRVARSDERITVEVEHGLVEVVFRGTTARVGPAQRWSSEQPGEVAAVEATRVEVPARTTATATVPAGDPTATTKPAAGTPVTDTSVTDKRLTNTSLATQVTDKDRAMYDRLTSMEARDPGAALDGYLDLSRGSGPWAEIALYAAGRLAADRHDHRAETLLTIYLRRFPSGANAADARQLLDRLKGDHP